MYVIHPYNLRRRLHTEKTHTHTHEKLLRNGIQHKTKRNEIQPQNRAHVKLQPQLLLPWGMLGEVGCGEGAGW